MICSSHWKYWTSSLFVTYLRPITGFLVQNFLKYCVFIAQRPTPPPPPLRRLLKFFLPFSCFAKKRGVCRPIMWPPKIINVQVSKIVAWNGGKSIRLRQLIHSGSHLFSSLTWSLKLHIEVIFEVDSKLFLCAGNLLLLVDGWKNEIFGFLINAMNFNRFTSGHCGNNTSRNSSNTNDISTLQRRIFTSLPQFCAHSWNELCTLTWFFLSFRCTTQHQAWFSEQILMWGFALPKALRLRLQNLRFCINY